MNGYLAAAASALLFLAAGDRDEALRKDLEALQGNWQPVSVTVNGQALDKERLKDDSMLIRKNTFVLRSGAGSTGGTFLIDPTKNPKTMDTETLIGEAKGTKSVGIYQLEGDTLRVCYSTDPKARPTEFSAGKDSKRALVVYQRAKP
jgi:uncharacterized protein (TIGR03067 family)